MKKIISFFKTSPLSKGDLIIRTIALVVLAAMFITGSIYLMVTQDFSGISFMAVGIIILGMGLWGINPPVFEAWLRFNNPPNNDDSK
jgi:hypothetical protein